MNDPGAYVMIRRWGRMLGSHESYIRDEQLRAAQDAAPLDAIFKHVDGWHRARHVTNAATRECLGLPPYAPADD